MLSRELSSNSKMLSDEAVLAQTQMSIIERQRVEEQKRCAKIEAQEALDTHVSPGLPLSLSLSLSLSLPCSLARALSLVLSYEHTFTCIYTNICICT